MERPINYSWYTKCGGDGLRRTAWDSDLRMQIARDSWNAICAKALQASRSIKYKLRKRRWRILSPALPQRCNKEREQSRWKHKCRSVGTGNALIYMNGCEHLVAEEHWFGWERPRCLLPCALKKIRAQEFKSSYLIPPHFLSPLSFVYIMCVCLSGASSGNYSS